VSQDRNEQRARSIVINVQRLTAGNTVVHLVGDLIGDATAAMQQALIDELSREPAQLIVDVSAITRIDAGGVHALAAAAAVAGESDRAFGLVAGKAGPVRAALAAEQLSELFEIFSSTIEAVQDSR
jgi:anti-anti-sigma regulatory factor